MAVSGQNSQVPNKEHMVQPLVEELRSLMLPGVAEKVNKIGDPYGMAGL